MSQCMNTRCRKKNSLTEGGKEGVMETLSRRYFIISVIKHIAVVMSEKSRRRKGDNETDGDAHLEQEYSENGGS